MFILPLPDRLTMLVQRAASAHADRQMQNFYFAKNVISSDPEWEETGDELLTIPSGFSLAGKAKQAWQDRDYRLSVPLSPLHYFGNSVKTASGLVLWQLWTGVFCNTWELLRPNDNTYKVTCRYTGTLRIAVSCTTGGRAAMWYLPEVSGGRQKVSVAAIACSEPATSMNWLCYSWCTIFALSCASSFFASAF